MFVHMELPSVFLVCVAQKISVSQEKELVKNVGVGVPGVDRKDDVLVMLVVVMAVLLALCWDRN